MNRCSAWILAAVAAVLFTLPGVAQALAPAAVPGPLAALFHAGGAVPAGLGLRQGRLRPCSAPDHCVREDWPLADPAAALAELVPVVAALSGTRIERQVGEPAPTYLHASAESRIFGFIDDLELAVDPAAGVLQVRSESRLGDSDLGVNQRRVDRLHQALRQVQPR